VFVSGQKAVAEPPKCSCSCLIFLAPPSAWPVAFISHSLSLGSGRTLLGFVLAWPGFGGARAGESWRRREALAGSHATREVSARSLPAEIRCL
jgi:hypothetical protein